MSAWEKNVRKVTPYTPGEQPKVDNVVKLNTNESPYPPSPMVEKVLKEMDKDRLRLYPDPDASELVETIADYYQVNSSQVFVGVGSDEVIGMAFLTFFNSERPIIFPDITYSFYDVWADLFKIDYITKPLNQNFEIVKEDYFGENGGVIFPNPNAPTAVEIGLEDIEDIVKSNQDVVVIVDEAYADFGDVTALDLIEKYENLLVVRTYSKSRALAGMRIGYAIGSEKLIEALKAVKFSYNSYTMNMPSIILGLEAVKDDAYFKETVHKIVDTRERAKVRFKELGFTCLDSRTNFLFITHEKVAAKEIFEALKKNQIYVRYFAAPRLDNYLRVSIGTDEEMEAVYEFLASYLQL